MRELERCPKCKTVMNHKGYCPNCGFTLEKTERFTFQEETTEELRKQLQSLREGF